MTRRLVQFPDGLWHPIKDTPPGVSPYYAMSLCGKEIMFTGSFLSNVPPHRLCELCKVKLAAVR